MERIKYLELPEGMFEHLRSIEDYITKSSLPTSLLLLAKLRVSQINGCAYCIDMHHKELKHLGETDLRLVLLAAWEEADLFTNSEKAVLHYAEALTKIDHHPLPETVFKELATYFNKSEISYISLAITQINTWNRLMKAFGFTPGNYVVPQSS